MKHTYDDGYNSIKETRRAKKTKRISHIGASSVRSASGTSTSTSTLFSVGEGVAYTVHVHGSEIERALLVSDQSS